jgi:hypothetical protein
MRSMSAGVIFLVHSRVARSFSTRIRIVDWQADSFPSHLQPSSRSIASTVTLCAKPLHGSAIESYQTVSINFAKCGTLLFRYKKKNGTKTNLVKAYVERICKLTTQVHKHVFQFLYTYSSLTCVTFFIAAEDSARIVEGVDLNAPLENRPWQCTVV